MKTVLFDIEADDLYPRTSRMWVGVTQVLETEEVRVFREADIVGLLECLNSADRIVAHNGIWFDRPALEKISGITITTPLADTLVMSRLAYSDIENHPIGGNGIEDWGNYFGIKKKEFHDWTKWSPEMEEYCIRDVEILRKTYEHLLPIMMEMPFACKLEHDVSRGIFRQWDNGFGFDVAAAKKMSESLAGDELDVLADIQRTFPVRNVVMKTKTKVFPFNPNSPQQVCKYLKDRGWVPTVFTKAKQPSTEAKILEEIVDQFPEVQLLLDFKKVSKIRGLVDLCIELTKDGVLHGEMNTNGTVTGRMSHSNPPITQIPKVRKGKTGRDGKWGHECRSLFHPVHEGWMQVGADASGLELRMLAHYLARWDGGKYAEIVTTGDVHTYNQKAVGLPTRDDAKTFIYALIYGAGEEKLGRIIKKGRLEGKRLKQSFIHNVKGLRELMNWVRNMNDTKGHVLGLDGRRLPIRSDHLILNTLLQSAGAVVMKTAFRIVTSSDVFVSGKALMMGNFHDEWQAETCIDPKTVGQLMVDSIKETKNVLRLRCPLDGEYKFGRSWAETH